VIDGPSVSRPAVHLAALADPSIDPRPVDDPPDLGVRRADLPAAEPPSATAATLMVADRGARPGGTEASVTLVSGGGEAEASLGFDDLFNESSLPRYADVS